MTLPMKATSSATASTWPLVGHPSFQRWGLVKNLGGRSGFALIASGRTRVKPLRTAS